MKKRRVSAEQSVKSDKDVEQANSTHRKLSQKDLVRYIQAAHASKIAVLEAEKAELEKRMAVVAGAGRQLALQKDLDKELLEVGNDLADRHRILAIARRTARDLAAELSDTYGVDLTTHGIDTESGAFVQPPEA